MNKTILTKMPSVSLLDEGEAAKVSRQDVPLADIYRYITGEEAKDATLALRAADSTEQQRCIKRKRFKACTPHGTFYQRRKQENLIQESGMMVIDFDHLTPGQHAELLQRLPLDQRYETELMFTSPSGHGIKWFIACGSHEGATFRSLFEDICLHICGEYGVRPDPSGKDLPRCCFLPWDPQCYINPRFIAPTATNA